MADILVAGIMLYKGTIKVTIKIVVYSGSPENQGRKTEQASKRGRVEECKRERERERSKKKSDVVLAEKKSKGKVVPRPPKTSGFRSFLPAITTTVNHHQCSSMLSLLACFCYMYC